MNAIVPRIMIIASAGLSAEKIAELNSLFGNEAKFVVVPDNKESISLQIEGSHALIGCPRPLFSEELLRRAGPCLSWIHVSGSGCEEFLIPSLIKSSITLTSGKIIQGPSVADHAVALLLCLTRNLHLILKEDVSKMPRPIELRGKTALIIGCGGIGTLIAERLFSFGMEIFGVTPEYIPLSRIWSKLFPPDRLVEVLPKADAIFVSAPLTPRTEKSIGIEEFLLMKETAFFINVARGQIVDTQALTGVLQKGRLKGVGLDVTEPDPLPLDHPLRKMDHVIITPHVAGPSDKNWERSFQLICNNVERFLKGQSLINVINKDLGY